MRWNEIITEQARVGRRLWLSPDNAVYDIDEDWISHDKFISKHPDLFGFDIEQYRMPETNRYNGALLIAHALELGWVRISTDLATYSHDSLAINARTPKRAAQAAQWLRRNAVYPDAIEVEIEGLSNGNFHRFDFFRLEGNEIDLFVKNGVKPRQLVEGVAIVPRMWIGPQGQVIQIDDWGVGHAERVWRHPEDFGITLDDLSFAWDTEEEQYLYDLVIAYVEELGWVRVSHDTVHSYIIHAIAISASSLKDAHRALLILARNGHHAQHIEIEIERIVNGTRETTNYVTLADNEVDHFLKYGKLPLKRRYGDLYAA